MTPKKLTTRPGDREQARSRARIADKYLEVAQLVDAEDGAAVNVCVGLAVLAGIAAGDAICLAATGERYSGSDHQSAADLLGRVDVSLGKHLRRLASAKPASHYGERLLGTNDRAAALRAAEALVADALLRTA